MYYHFDLVFKNSRVSDLHFFYRYSNGVPMVFLFQECSDFVLDLEHLEHHWNTLRIPK